MSDTVPLTCDRTEQLQPHCLKDANGAFWFDFACLVRVCQAVAPGFSATFSFVPGAPTILGSSVSSLPAVFRTLP